MKKNLFLFVFSIVFLALLVSSISADSLATWPLTDDNLEATEDNTNINAGDFSAGDNIGTIEFYADDSGIYAGSWPTDDLDADSYFQITLSPNTGYDLTISAINFDIKRSENGPEDYQVIWSKNSDFSSSTSITTKTLADDSETSGNLTVSIAVNEGETIYIRIFGYNSDGGTLKIGDLLNIEGTVTTAEEETEDIGDFCAWDEGIAENPGELSVKIKDINILSDGFGDDNEWLPFDEVEVEIEIENEGDYDLSDIQLEWGLYNTDSEEWTIEVDDVEEFDIDENDEETYTFTFELDDDMDEDLEDLNDGENYILYVRATGEIDDNNADDLDGADTCHWDSEDIEIIIEDDFVILKDIEFPEIIECGSKMRVTADVWNIGDDDQDDVSVKISSKQLDIDSELIEIGDIDSFESDNFDVTIDIPNNAEEGSYIFELEVFDEDGDIYENDYDDEESSFTFKVDISGSCSDSASGVSAIVSAVLESGGKAGEQLVIKATLTNTGEDATFLLNAAGYAQWADKVDLNKNSIDLGLGDSEEITFTFDVNKDASGEQLFDIEVISGNSLVVSQPVSVTIESSSQNLSELFGENWYLWLIGLLNVVLVVIIIIVAIKVSKK